MSKGKLHIMEQWSYACRKPEAILYVLMNKAWRKGNSIPASFLSYENRKAKPYLNIDDANYSGWKKKGSNTRPTIVATESFSLMVRVLYLNDTETSFTFDHRIPYSSN